MRLIPACLLALAILGEGPQMSVPLRGLHSGYANVRYFHPPQVVLEWHPASGEIRRIPLTYDLQGQQRIAEIWQARLVAESPG